jgi:hypothetical protein
LALSGLSKPTIRPLADLTAGSTIAFGVTAYNDGEAILPTLRSLWSAMSALELNGSAVILSESYDVPTLSCEKFAREWADTAGVRLQINSSARRRSLKEALNTVFDQAQADVLVVVVDDVLVPSESLAILLRHLYDLPRPVAAIGSTLPDPEFSGLRRKAGAWQLRAVTRAARLSRQVIDSRSFRAEGAFWGVWRAFYATYRFPLGSGSIHDDVEFTSALIERGYACRNAADAHVYKVPAQTLLDLCSGTVRGRVALPGRTRQRAEYAAAVIETARDPLGAFLYGMSRLWCRLTYKRRLRDSSSEQWRVSKTTKRKTTDDR